MKLQPLPDFDVLAWKAEAQERIQAELAGLTPEQTIEKIRESVERGPLSTWWESVQPEPHLPAAPTRTPR